MKFWLISSSASFRTSRTFRNIWKKVVCWQIRCELWHQVEAVRFVKRNRRMIWHVNLIHVGNAKILNQLLFSQHSVWFRFVYFSEIYKITNGCIQHILIQMVLNPTRVFMRFGIFWKDIKAKLKFLLTKGNSIQIISANQ